MKKYFGSMLCLLTMICGVCPRQIHAESFETLENINSAVEKFAAQHTEHHEDETVSIVITQFDNVKLPRCPSPLEASFAAETKSTVVRLACPEGEGWHLFVPIQIRIMTPVLTLNRTMAAGEVITENDLVLEQYDKTRLLDGYFKEKSDVLGWSTARTLSPGIPLTSRNLRQQLLVKRNETITLALRKGAIDIEMTGIAKSDGVMDSGIKVLNPASKKMVDAVVTGRGRAEIIH